MKKSNISKNLLFTQKHFDLLVQLYQNSFVDTVLVADFYNIITETLVDGLSIDRASYWELLEDRLVCINLFDKNKGCHSLSNDIQARDLPNYFQALNNGIAIVADDARTNDYTKELKYSYLIPNGITDMLDLPIRENGSITGVLCCEHRDQTRNWSESDLAFAKAIADILIVMIAQYKRRKTELKLIDSERKLSLITDNSTDGFVVFENSIVTYISPSYRKLLGYSENELQHFSLQEVYSHIHPDEVEGVREFINEHLAKQAANFKYEFRIKGKLDKYFWREDTASVLYEHGQYTKYILISRDITAQKNAEIKIQKLYSISKIQNKKLLDFTHIISHNIRSNTSNMAMIIELMADTTDEVEKKEYFELLKESNYKLSETIQYLNDTISLKLNVKQQKVVVNLKSIIEKSLIGINVIIRNQRVLVNVNIAEDIFIRTIPSYFESIIFNLVTNAIKYKSPHCDPIITINTTKITAQQYRISVIDNGLGIDMTRNGDKIFGMYKTFHGNPDAVGLGLFMTKNHVEALGGTIAVSSEVGIGSEFKFTLYE
ncbi:GAF domain-containing sensor histidine kinase [Flavobacterium restrictum]|uniref:histidine kinase n=1 Tax=Flavobacterium restrictum TaxID=2594428 RepID=A0A553E721_9FLAO|nr:ATP-binding protein [Flavobacterium restrictum]TRX40795.1 PAS domain S-box protein [Flavobacterium restrictum]